MEDFGITKELWRKTGQWIILTRKHAQLMADDGPVAAGFHRECQGEDHCLSSEHYPAVLLAVHGLEEEADSSAALPHTEWPDPDDWHPKTYEPEEVRGWVERKGRVSGGDALCTGGRVCRPGHQYH